MERGLNVYAEPPEKPISACQTAPVLGLVYCGPPQLMRVPGGCVPGTTSIASTKAEACPAIAVVKRIVIVPLTGMAWNDSITAVFEPPAACTTSNDVSTREPLMSTLNRRWPVLDQKRSAKSRYTL